MPHMDPASNAKVPSSSSASKPRKRFVGTKSATPSKRSYNPAVANQIPQEILSDARLNTAMSALPSNYSFEVHKTIWHVRKNNSRMVALQMPEGLQMFACTIADIIEQFTPATTTIMGDVTYGACCIDDYTAVALGCDMLVHYGHSCLVPIDQTTIKTLYVFVEIAIDSSHLLQTVRMNFPDDRQQFRESLLLSEETESQIPAGERLGKGRHLRIEGPSTTGDGEDSLEKTSSSSEPTRLALVSTIQFVAALSRLKDNLTTEYSDPRHPSGPAGLLEGGESKDSVQDLSTPHPENLWTGRYDAIIPQSKPLSPGEILGCTAPQLSDVDALLYLGDGRFHLESIMIANPSIPAFRYDPYSKKLTRERYNHSEMRSIRNDAVTAAKRSIDDLTPSPDATLLKGEAPLWGVILGTLGRQGSFRQLQAITHQLTSAKTNIPFMPILLSELSPAKLALFNPHISTFVQTSCPRLSIDWGYAFDKPLLSPYETAVATGKAVGWIHDGDTPDKRKESVYPMDFYTAGTPWAIARSKALYP